jgi:mannose-1-phosphate guanylyltransferase
VKAVILAGGKGTRGKPYTEYFPKAMTPIKGKPLIGYVVDYLNSFSFIKEIIIISDYEGLGGQIKNYYDNTNNKKNITFVQDSQSGTGGDLLHIENKLKGESEFVLWFVDNLCAIDLKKMRDFFIEKKSTACIATRTTRKEETGFAVVKDGIITEFKEKPKMKLQLSECLGIYILGKDILKRIKAKSKQKEINLSFDILQELSKERKISAYDIGDREWIDAESPMVLERNKKTVQKIIEQMGL